MNAFIASERAFMSTYTSQTAIQTLILSDSIIFCLFTYDQLCPFVVLRNVCNTKAIVRRFLVRRHLGKKKPPLEYMKP